MFKLEEMSLAIIGRDCSFAYGEIFNTIKNEVLTNKRRDLGCLLRLKKDLALKDQTPFPGIFTAPNQDWAEFLHLYLDVANLPTGSLNNMKSSLKSIREVALSLDEMEDDDCLTLAILLKTAQRKSGLKNKAFLKDVKEQTGKSIDTAYYGVTCGPYPRSSKEDLEKVFKYLNIKIDVERFLRNPDYIPPNPTSSDAIKGRDYNFGLTTHGYHWPWSGESVRNKCTKSIELINPNLIKRILMFIDYKQGSKTNLNRDDENLWTYNSYGECSTLNTFYKITNAFYGFLVGELAFEVNELTFLMLADAVLVRKYEDFLKKTKRRRIHDHCQSVAFIFEPSQKDVWVYISTIYKIFSGSRLSQ